MSAAKRVFRHTLIQLVSRTLGTALGLLAIGIMTRELGTFGFGAYTTVTAYLGVFAILADFGISTTLVAMLSEKDAEEPSLIKNALGMRLALTGGILSLAAAIGWFLPYSTEIKIGIIAMIVSFLAIGLNQTQIAVFQRHLRMDRPAIAEVTGRLLLVIGVFWAARVHAGLFGMIAAVIAANIVQTILAAIFIRGLAPIWPAANPQIWKKIFVRAWPIGASIALTLIYLRADTLILSLTRSQSEVGIYGAAYRVVDVLTVIPMLFMGVVLPFLSNTWSFGDRERFSRVLGRALDALSLAAAPLALGTLALGPDLLALVAGEPFRESGEVLRVLIFGVAAIFVGAAFTHSIVAIGAQKRMIPLLAANAFVSLALYLIYIPRYGLWAAALVTLFSELFATASAYFVARRFSGIKISLRTPALSVVSAAIMAVLLFFVPTFPLALKIILGALVYGAAAILLRAVSLNTVRELLAWRDN